MWTKPEATEMRFGFEVTMYVCNRYGSNVMVLKTGAAAAVAFRDANNNHE